MAINPTLLLRYLKRRLGASHKPIPLSDEDIMATIYEESLYTFSNYFPFMYDIIINCNTDKVPDPEKSCVYFLNSDGLEILGVAKTFRSEGVLGERYPYLGSSNVFDIQMQTDLISMVSIPETFEFIPPNKVELFPKYIYSDKLLCRIKCIHPQHLGTIPISLRNEFFKLAEYDTKMALFEILKNYDSINTAFGNLELKIENLEQAEDKRDQLLEVWDQRFLREANRKKIYVY